MSTPAPRPLGDPVAAPPSSDPDPVAELLATMGQAQLQARRAETDRLVEDDGVLAGSARRRRHRWALDPLPVVVQAQDWAAAEVGLIQRARLMQVILSDLYGPGWLLRERVVPAEVVLANPAFVRAAVGSPQPPKLVLSATDLVRSPDGTWQALADRTQVPTGAGYAVEARRVVARVLPATYRATGMHRLRPFVDALRAALQDLAPAAEEAARVVVLAPEEFSETAFDHAFLATLLGYPLATSEDVTVRGGAVYLRSLGRLERVDVVLRRVADADADSLELVSNSTAGVPGLIGAWRRGAVAVANPIGSGVLESPGLQPFLADASRMLLGEELALAAPETFWCGTPGQLQHVLANLERMVAIALPVPGSVLAPIDASTLSARQREQLSSRISAEPHRWCAQLKVDPQSVPVITAEGIGHVGFTMRAFTVADGDTHQVMPGGLGRVLGLANAARANSALAPAKDVWVLTSAAESGVHEESVAPAGTRRAARPGWAGVDGVDGVRSVGAPLAPRVAEHLFSIGTHLERAESLVRLLRVVDDLNEDWAAQPTTPGAHALVELRAALDASTGAEGLPLWRLIGDESLPGALASVVAAMVDGATAVREQLSGDVWMVLGGLERTLAEVVAQNDSGALQPVLARLLEGLLALAGLAAESLVRDTGWYLMDAGRRLERADAVLALLLSTVSSGRAETAVLEAVLLAAESVITHRRRHPGGATPASVIELLVGDADNPRSVAMQLDRLQLDLAQLPGPHDDPMASQLAALIDLAHTASSGPELLHLRSGLRQIRDLLHRRHLSHVVAPRPLSPSGQWGR